MECGNGGFWAGRKGGEPVEKNNRTRQEPTPTTKSTHIWYRAGIELGPHSVGGESSQRCSIPANGHVDDINLNYY